VKTARTAYAGSRGANATHRSAFKRNTSLATADNRAANVININIAFDECM